MRWIIFSLLRDNIISGSTTSGTTNDVNVGGATCPIVSGNIEFHASKIGRWCNVFFRL